MSSVACCSLHLHHVFFVQSGAHTEREATGTEKGEAKGFGLSKEFSADEVWCRIENTIYKFTILQSHPTQSRLRHRLVGTCGKRRDATTCRLHRSIWSHRQSGRMQSDASGECGDIVVRHATPLTQPSAPSSASYAAYVTFARSEDALKCITTINNTQVDGRILKASVGTTKYCSQFLRNVQCTKEECLYLHEIADPAHSFTKVQLSTCST